MRNAIVYKYGATLLTLRRSWAFGVSYNMTIVENFAIFRLDYSRFILTHPQLSAQHKICIFVLFRSQQRRRQQQNMVTIYYAIGFSSFIYKLYAPMLCMYCGTNSTTQKFERQNTSPHSLSRRDTFEKQLPSQARRHSARSHNFFFYVCLCMSEF